MIILNVVNDFLYYLITESPMIFTVFSSIFKKHQIFKSVIILYSINMMNYFFSCKVSPKMFLHD